MNWQPIETAPMDGTPVLVWDGDDGLYVAYYSAIVKAWIDQKPTGWPEYEIKMWYPLPPPPTVNESFTVPFGDDLGEPLGKACSMENPECESCQ